MQTRLLIACGVLIAVAAASITGLVISLSRPPAAVVNAPPHVLTLAASTSGNTITVVGVGTGSATPNQGQLMLGVLATRPNVRDAVSAATSDETKLLNALHRQGVQDKDIQTASLSVSQQTQCCPQTVTGYQAGTSFNITVHSISGVTSLVEAGVDAVGNDLQINGINVTVADQGPMLRAARSAAIADASEKAQDYARLTGHHVGGLIGVSEVIASSGQFTCDQCGGKGAGGGSFQIQPGVTTVTVTVAVTYEIGS